MATDQTVCEMSCGRRAAFRAQRFDEGGARLACGNHLAAAVRIVSPDGKPVMVTPLGGA